MADTKLTALPAVTVPTNADTLYTVQSGVSSQITYENLQNGFNPWTRKNAAMNANFDIWQRGTTGFTGTSATADRWQMDEGDGTADVSRQAFTVGQTDVPGEPEFYARFNQSVATTAQGSAFVQRIESVRTLAGEAVVLSFWAKVGSGTYDVTPRFQQRFGTGGSTSVVVAATPATVELTTTWQKFTVTATLPSISGKTIAGGNDNLMVQFIFPLATSTFTLDFAQVQLELGSVASTFERIPPGEEIVRCERYYQKSYNVAVDPGTVTFFGSVGAIGNGTSHIQPISLRNRLRAAPTVVLYNPNSGASGSWRDTNANADRTTAAANIGDAQFRVDVTASVDNNRIEGHWTADAESLL